MAGDVVKRIAEAATERMHLLFLLHGGEPLLMSGASFEHFVSEMRRARDKLGHEVAFAIQTNGTLLTEDWIDRLLQASDLLGERTIGISLDGAQPSNDTARRFPSSSRSSHTLVVNALDRLKAVGLNYGLLCVVGTHNVELPVETYRTLSTLGSKFLRFLPCYNAGNDGNAERFGITPSMFTDFMLSIFECWVKELPLRDHKDQLVVDPLVSILANLSGSFTPWCEYRGAKCENFLAIYPSGEMWLCDTFNHATHRPAAYLGDFNEVSQTKLSQILAAPCNGCGFDGFRDGLLDDCTKCSISSVCQGGCLPVRDGFRSRTAENVNLYCAARQRLIQGIRQVYLDAVP